MALCAIVSGVGISACAQNITSADSLVCRYLPTLPTPPSDAVKVTDYGAVPNDDQADDAAIARALAAVRPGGWLVFPPGRYVQAGSVLVTRPDITIWGFNAELQATNPQDHTFGLRADGVRLYGLKLTTVTDKRRSEPQHSRVSIMPLGTGLIRGNVVRRVQVEGAGAGGILVLRAADFTVAENQVQNTLADGIHMTGGSHHGRVVLNQVRNTGDDMIAVVSYANESPVRDVLVVDNDVAGTSWGRGLSIVGGERITLHSNTVADVLRAAGVLVAQEGNWNTHGVNDARVESNRLRAIQTPARTPATLASERVQLTGHGAIEVHAIQVPSNATGVGNLVLRGNVVESAGTVPLRIGADTPNGLIKRVAQTDPPQPDTTDIVGARLDCAVLNAH